MKRILSFLVLSTAVAGFTGCSSNQPANKTYSIQYEVGSWKGGLEPVRFWTPDGYKDELATMPKWKSRTYVVPFGAPVEINHFHSSGGYGMYCTIWVDGQPAVTDSIEDRGTLDCKL